MPVESEPCPATRLWKQACASLAAPAADDAWQTVLDSSPPDSIWHSVRNCVAYQAGVWLKLLGKGMEDVSQPAAFKLALALRHTPVKLSARLLSDLLSSQPQSTQQELKSYVLTLLTDCGRCAAARPAAVRRLRAGGAGRAPRRVRRPRQAGARRVHEAPAAWLRRAEGQGAEPVRADPEGVPHKGVRVLRGVREGEHRARARRPPGPSARRQSLPGITHSSLPIPPTRLSKQEPDKSTTKTKFIKILVKRRLSPNCFFKKATLLKLPLNEKQTLPKEILFSHLDRQR